VVGDNPRANLYYPTVGCAGTLHSDLISPSNEWIWSAILEIEKGSNNSTLNPVLIRRPQAVTNLVYIDIIQYLSAQSRIL
jgi:hypothetical protein